MNIRTHTVCDNSLFLSHIKDTFKNERIFHVPRIATVGYMQRRRLSGTIWEINLLLTLSAILCLLGEIKLIGPHWKHLKSVLSNSSQQRCLAWSPAVFLDWILWSNQAKLLFPSSLSYEQSAGHTSPYFLRPNGSGWANEDPPLVIACVNSRLGVESD